MTAKIIPFPIERVKPTGREFEYVKFVFISNYAGISVNGKNEIKVYMFAPEIDISKWQMLDFWHSDSVFSPEYMEFKEWLSTLEEDNDYIIEEEYFSNLDDGFEYMADPKDIFDDLDETDNNYLD